jgi:hypothetical protein
MLVAGLFKELIYMKNGYTPLLSMALEDLSLIFRYTSTDEGFCRVYYWTQLKLNGPKTLFCLQQDTKNSVKLYECSKDGEPSHEVMLGRHWVFHFPKIEDRSNPTHLEILVNKFIKTLHSIGGAK